MLALVLCFGAAAQEAEQLANNHDIALQLKADGRWDDLLRHLDLWESEGGQDLVIHELRTEAMRESGNITGAIESMKELQKETPQTQRARHAEILRELGQLQEEQGNLAEAEKSYRRSLAINEVALTWLNIAQLLVKKDPINEEAADAAWRKTLSYGQYLNEPDLWMTYAEFRDMLDDQEQSYKAFEHVVRLAPDDVHAWQRLFALADDLDKEAVQKIIVSRLTRINLTDPFANAYLGREAHLAGDKRLANHHYNIAVQSDDASFAKWRAISFWGLAQNAATRGEAVEYYREAVIADPTLFSAWENVITTLRRMRRFPEARVYSDKFFRVRRYLAEGEDLPEDILDGI